MCNGPIALLREKRKREYNMKAAVLHNKRDIRYEEVEKPRISDEEVLIAVKACGICGSDIPRYLADVAHSYPIILGHEFS